MGNEITEKPKTSLSAWNGWAVDMIQQDYAACSVPLDDYNRQCAMNAMGSIYDLVMNDGKTDLSQIDSSSIRDAVGQAASLRLNANAIPAECYFQLRKRKSGNGQWVTRVEMGIMGDGNNAILRNFGENVDTVYPEWIVHEGDDFKYPAYKGIEVAPPEWSPKGKSNKVDKVVTIVKLTTGEVRYLIQEREDCRINLVAHIRNNMLNETFGLAKDRYSATQAQLKEIAEKKEEIMAQVRDCETIDAILDLPAARPFISMAWLDSTESMIARKLSNNSVKKFKKNFDVVAKRSFNQTDEVYVSAQEEIAELENSVDFDAAVVDAESVVIE